MPPTQTVNALAPATDPAMVSAAGNQMPVSRSPVVVTDGAPTAPAAAVICPVKVGDPARTGAPVPVAVVHTIADPVPPPTAICEVVPLVDTPVPPRVTPRVAETLHVPDEIVGTPVDAEKF